MVDLNDGLISPDNLITTTKEISNSYKRTILKEGDLVIALRGKIGEVAYIKKTLAGSNLTRGVALLAINKDYLNQFVKQQLKSEPQKKIFENRLNGSALKEIAISVLRKIPVSLPPTKAEQTAIADTLSDADALIQSLEKLIAKKRLIKQGAMQELLKPKEGWVVKKLGGIGTFKKGKGIKKDEVSSDGFPCVRYGELYTHHHEYIKKFNSFISVETAKESQRINKGDLLFAGSGETKEEIGKCAAFVDEIIAYAGGDVIILSPNNCDSLFLGFLLNHEKVAKQKAQKAQGDAVVHIYPCNLSEIDIPLPPTKAEQARIATILSDIDAEISALETKLAKYKQVKQGMMQELLTGKIRLI